MNLFCLYCCLGFRWQCGNFGLINGECIWFKSLDFNVISFLCMLNYEIGDMKWKSRFMSIHFSDEEELNLDSKSKQIRDCGFSLYL